MSDDRRSDDPQRIEAIVTSALEIATPDQRSAYLDAACGEDSALRAWVEALIRAREQAAAEPPSTVPGISRANGDQAQSASSAASAAEDSTAAESDHGEQYSLDFLAPPTQPGSLGRLAHYDILEVLGQGAFGIVFKAFDGKLHRMVAIKVLSPALAASSTARRRFIREARAAAAVRHEHLIDIHAVDEQPVPFLVMEYVSGQTLHQKLERSAPLELKEILRIGLQIASGLAAAHKQGQIHRDIKPANILLENGIEQVKITDFGLARAVDDASITQSGVVAGTPMYMAPEQALGERPDHRADLFSLGTVLYVMCTGRPPFRAGGTMAILKRVCEDTPRPIREINSEIPEWLSDVISKLHAKKPEDRFQSAKEVADLLSSYLQELQLHGQVVPGRAGGISPPVTPRPTSAVADREADAPRSPNRPRRRWVKLVIVLAVIALLVWRFGPSLVLTARNKGQITVELDAPQAGYSLVARDGGRVARPGAGGEVLPGVYELRIHAPPGQELAGLSVLHQTMFTGHYEPNLSAPPKELYIGRGDRVTITATFRDAIASKTASAEEGQWTSLFNGENLTGWKTHPDQPGDWKVADGILVGSGRPSFLFSERGDYEDFHLLAEIKLNKGGNSGVFFRAGFGLPRKPAWGTNTPEGYEAEVFHEPSTCQTGSVVHFQDFQGTLSKPDEWFKLEIIAERDHIRVKVNGTTASDFVDRAGTYAKGHIALQMHFGGLTVVQFRKIEIMELRPSKPSESLIAGWGTAIDPQGDCKFEVNQGRLALTVPAGEHDLNPAPDKNVLAPRVLQEVEGDFTLQVHVHPFPLPPRGKSAAGSDTFRAAGLLVWQDAQNYLRFATAATGARHFLQAEWWQEGTYGGADGTAATHLQIQRQASRLRLRTSADGKTWEDWKTVDLELSSKIQVGVVAMSAVRESSSFEFENVPSQPLLSAAPPPAVAPFDDQKASERQEAWAKHLGVDVEIKNSLDMKFRLIPSGEFRMGSSPGEIDRVSRALAAKNPHWAAFVACEGPQQTVRIDQPFYLGAHEVTIGQFRKFVEAAKHKTYAESSGKGAWHWSVDDNNEQQQPEWNWANLPFKQTDEHPVVGVTWGDAQAFCLWLKKEEGREYMLPTESQWEFACRAGSPGAWCFGDDARLLPDYAWITYDSGTRPVGAKKPNAFGLYDMHGNAHEYCLDNWVPHRAEPGRETREPIKGDSRHCVIRGGCWVTDEPMSRSAYRRWEMRTMPSTGHGFRVAIVGDLKPPRTKESAAKSEE